MELMRMCHRRIARSTSQLKKTFPAVVAAIVVEVVAAQVLVAILVEAVALVASQKIKKLLNQLRMMTLMIYEAWNYIVNKITPNVCIPI
jgi:hypothetical protein